MNSLTIEKFLLILCLSLSKVHEVVVFLLPKRFSEHRGPWPIPCSGIDLLLFAVVFPSSVIETLFLSFCILQLKTQVLQCVTTALHYTLGHLQTFHSSVACLALLFDAIVFFHIGIFLKELFHGFFCFLLLFQHF